MPLPNVARIARLTDDERWALVVKLDELDRNLRADLWIWVTT